VAKKLAGLRVIATASRSESRAWCRQFGADDIINHFEDIPAQLQSLGLKYVDYILCANNPEQHFAALAKVIAPQGKICSVVETTSPVDLRLLMNKSAAWVWEFMFTRALYQTPDMTAQHELLSAAAALVDDGTLRTTLSEVLGPIDAANLRIAHRRLEEGRTVGKLVLEGF
jgi:NADPH:quinone reductase